ncbi:MAG: fasciclin domain-containing protein [Parafilimonas sp.]
MKKFILKPAIFVTICLSGFLLFSSCNKNDNNPAPPASGTITDVVSADADLSLLKTGVVKADLATTLSGPGPFTLFAPTDEAFAAAGITSDVINSLPTDDLSNLLLYHVIDSKILAADVPAGPNAKVITASGDSVFVTNNANGVFVNGAQVTQADIMATNGVVHKINAVLMPAVGNLVVSAQADTSLTYLVAAVLRASTGSTDVASVLSGSNILTLFAPTNNAFRAAGFATIDDINASDPDVLAGILTYHVVSGRIFSSDLTNGEQATTLNGGSITISTSASVTVKGNSNTSAANVVKANTVATNGVIHKIDQVLLP